MPNQQRAGEMQLSAPPQQNGASRTADGKIPVTILTGFLGAGKTTLLNHILSQTRAATHLNISVIENEWGEVNIDSELVADNLIEKEDLVSLDNGCVCCSLRKDIVKALAEIERRSRHRNKKVDQVILETTGLADPAPVAFTFFANPWIVSRYRLDSIVCVVDTRYVLQHLEEDSADGGINEIAQQLAFSDLILLNKTDLVDKQQMERVKQAVRRINQSATLHECQLNQEGGRPPLSLLLENNGFSVNKALKVDPEFLHSDSGSDLDSDSDSDVDSDGEGAAEAGAAEPCAGNTAAGEGGVDDIPSQPQSTAAAAAAKLAGKSAAEAEGSSAQQACCGSKQQEQAEADSSQLTSTTAVNSAGQAGRKRRGQHVHYHSHTEGACTDQYCKGERRPKRRRKQMHDLSGVGSVGIVARGPLDEYRFNMFMRDLLAEKAKDIFRCKGVLAVHGYGNQRFVFQGVHETICYGPSDKPWADNEPRINQIVFIGRKLDRKALMEGFKTCVWQKLPEGWLEFHDPISQQPYYYNPNTRQKTWARPIEQEYGAATVTATPLMSMEQPKSCLPSLNKRRSGSLTANQQANSSCSALTGREASVPLASPSAGAATGVQLAAAEAAAQLQQQQQQAPAAAAVAQPAAGN